MLHFPENLVDLVFITSTRFMYELLQFYKEKKCVLHPLYLVCMENALVEPGEELYDTLKRK